MFKIIKITKIIEIFICITLNSTPESMILVNWNKREVSTFNYLKILKLNCLLSTS